MNHLMLREKPNIIKDVCRRQKLTKIVLKLFELTIMVVTIFIP